MSVYKNIFVSDEFEGLEAGTQVQGIDGSVRVFGESAFSSLEQAVSTVAGKAVIARVASGKYDYFVADGNGSVSPASQVVFVDFNGGSDLSYDNGEYTRPVEMAPAAYSAAQQADVVAALNDLNAGSGVVFTASAPKGMDFSTVYVGSTTSFDDLGSFKGLSETVDAGNAVPNDEAFVNTNHISSVDELIEVIDHETGHLMGEEHSVTTGTISDFADPVYVAQIGETKYETLSAAYAAAQSGDTIKLLVSEISSITGIPAGVTLEGVEGKTIITDDAPSYLYLYLDDVTLKNLKFTGTNALYGCFVNGGYTATIDNCEFAQSGQYGLHFDNGTGSVVVTNSKLTGTVAIGTNISNISFTDCEFAGRSSVSGHCNINIYNQATFTNCTFTDDYTNGSKRGILMPAAGGTVELVGCSLANPASEYALTDIFRRDYVELGVIKTAQGEPVEFVAKNAGLVNDYLGNDELAWLGDSTILVYDRANGAVTVEGTVAGTITLDGSFDFKTAPGATYANGTVINIDASGATGELVKIFDTADDNLPTDGSVTFNITGGGDNYNAVVIDGDLYLQEKPYVAQIGETKYHTLSAAYAAAQSGDTIKILVTEVSGVDLATNMPVDGVTIEGVEGKTKVVSPFVAGDWGLATGIQGKTFGDFTMKNMSFTDPDMWMGIRNCSVTAGKTCTFENCDLSAKWCYTTNFGSGSGNVVIKDSYVAGWNSYTESLTSVTLENCVVDAGNPSNNYAIFRPYADATITNCQFTEAFVATLNTDEGSGIQLFGANKVMEISGCSVIKSKDDPTVSTEYTVKDLIVRDPYGDITKPAYGSNSKVGVPQDSSMIVVDPVKEGGKYTAGTFFSNSAATIDSYLATASLVDIVDSSRGLVYTLGETAAIEICESIAGTVDVPDGVELTVADGITYGTDAKLTGNVTFDIKDAAGSVTFDDSTVTSKISNITADATTAFVNDNTITGASISVAGTVTNTGALTIDPTANISAASFTNTGSITVDLTNFSGTMDAYRLIDTENAASSFGTVNFVGSETFETSVVDGDLYMKLKASPDLDQATEHHNTLGGKDDVQVTTSGDESTSVAGNIGTDNGTIGVNNNGTDSSLVVGNLTANEDITVESAAGSKDTSVGSIESQQDVSVTNGGNDMQLSEITAGGSVTIQNTGSGDMSIAGDTTVAEKLEIRNETDNDLSHSGKLAAKNIEIYNNEADDSKVGEIIITQEIAAVGDISITNASTKEVATNEGGTINLGTQEHTAQGGLNIVNLENNVINGGGSAAAGDEQAANITVKDNVVIENEGHLNANITTDGAIKIRNTSVNTLIGVYDGTSIELNNAGGNAEDVTLNGEVVSIYDDGTGTTGGTVVNATINADVLYMGGTTVEISDGTILNDGSTIYLPYAKEEDFPETVTAGAVLTISGDHTVGTNIIADDLDGALYGTLNMNGTQTYNGFRIGADTINVADGADITLDTVQADFNTLAITGDLTADFTALDSYTGAGTVSGSGKLHVATDGEWIVNESVKRDFSGFTGEVDMTEANASITLGAPGDGITPAATVAQSYFGDGAKVTAAAGQAVNLKGADVTTGIKFSGAGTLNVFENQTLTAANDIAQTEVAEGKTLTLKGATHEGDISLDMTADPTAVTKLVLDSDNLDFTGKITGDANDIITVAQEADLKSAEALNNFAGTVQVNADLDLYGANTTAAKFTGASKVEANADQTFSAASALDNFTGTLALNANGLTLTGSNVTAAAVTGTGSITAKADQTFSGDISGFTGTIDADSTAAATVTLSGTVANTLNLKGNEVILDDAITHATPIAVNAVTTLATLTANDNDIALGSGTFTTVTSTSGDIDLTGYTAGTLETLTTESGTIAITSAQDISVTGTTLGVANFAGDIAFTVTAAQAPAANADLTVAGTLTYTDAITVSAVDGTAAASSFFEGGYKLVSADTLVIADDWTLNLSINGASADITLNSGETIGGKLYTLTIDGTAGSGQSLVLTVQSAADTVYVNHNWTASPYAEVTDNYGTYYSQNPTKRNVGYDAAVNIDNALSYLSADDDGKGTIELTENYTFSVSKVLGDDTNKVTDMTLQSRADNGANAKVTGNISAGKATTLTLKNLTTTGSVYGAGTVNITGTKDNRFSGSVIAAGGALNITGGTYTSRYVAGGTYNAADEVTADTAVTISGTADRASFSGSVYGGSIAEGTGIAVTQSGKASVAIDASGSKKVYIAGNIYAAGLARSGATLTVTGDREVTFTGAAANLSFTGRVSGAAQGGTVSGGTANLTFADFTGKFNGSISDFDTVTISGGSGLQLGRRQTLTGGTALKFAVNADSDNTGKSMYTVRDKNAWEFAKTISITADNATASGTYILVDNYAAGFDDISFTVAGQNYTLGTMTTDNSGNTYVVNYQSEKLMLTFGNKADTQVIDNVASQDAKDKEFIIYNTDVNNASLDNADNVEKISATAGTTVVFDDATYAAKLDGNAAGAILYKDGSNDIQWVGNGDEATVSGGLSGANMDLSGKTLTVDNAAITNLTVDENATLNLTDDSTIGTITLDDGKDLTLDVGSNATVSGGGTDPLTITGDNGSVTITNAGTLTANVTGAGTVIISNTSTNSLYGSFGDASTQAITLDNSGKVENASFTATNVTLDDGVNAETGKLGYYTGITVAATTLTLELDLAGWKGSIANNAAAAYSFASSANVAKVNFTIDAATSMTAPLLAVTGADLSAAAYTVNGADYALDQVITIGNNKYSLNITEGNLFLNVLGEPATDMETIVVDENAGDSVIYEGKIYTVGYNAFKTVSEAMAARTDETDKLIVIQATDSVGSYDQGHSTASLELAKVTGSLTAKNYYIGHDTEDPWEGETFNATDTLVIEAGASLLTPAVQDNTAIYVRATGEVIANEGSVIGIQPNNIVNLLNYGKVTLNGTTAYLDGFANYGVDLNDNPETLGKAEFNAYDSTINVRGTLNSSHCNQYEVGGIQTAALIGGKPGKGDATVNLTDTDMTIETNFIVGYDKNGTLNVDGGSVTVGGTLGIGLDEGSGTVTLANAELTANAIRNGGTITAADGEVTINTDSFSGNQIQVLDGVTLSGTTGMLNVTGGVTLDGVTARTNSTNTTSQFDSDNSGSRDTIVVKDFTFENTTSSETGIYVGGYSNGVDVEVTGSLNLTGTNAFFNSYNASNVTVTETGTMSTTGQVRIYQGSSLSVTGTGADAMEDPQASLGYITLDGGALNLTDTRFEARYISSRNYGANQMTITNSEVTLQYMQTVAKYSASASNAGTITVDNSVITLTGSSSNEQGASNYTFNLVNGSTLTAASGRFDKQNGTFNIDNSSLYLGGTGGAKGASLQNSGSITVSNQGTLTTGNCVVNNTGAAITLAETAAMSMTNADASKNKLWNSGNLSLDVDAVLNGALDTASGAAVGVTGVSVLSSDVAGTKILTGALTDGGTAFKVEDVDASLNGSAVQIKGAETAETADDVWAQLSTSGDSLVVSWGRTEGEVATALEAFEEKKAELGLEIGQALTSTSAEISSVDDFNNKKNNGTLA